MLCDIGGMPVILRIGPYAFFFYAEEGMEPAHTHIRRDDALIKFWLDPVEMAYNYGFSNREARLLRRLVIENRDFLKEKWDEFFRRTLG